MSAYQKQVQRRSGGEQNRISRIIRRALKQAPWYANIPLGEMEWVGEVDVNIEKAIHHFQNYPKYDECKIHLTVAQIYERNIDFLRDLNLPFVSYVRIPADRHQIVGEFFVSAPGSPR